MMFDRTHLTVKTVTALIPERTGLTTPDHSITVTRYYIRGVSNAVISGMN